jgi:hypothetical protein
MAHDVRLNEVDNLKTSMLAIEKELETERSLRLEV